jgi:hypothetical protein
MEVLLLASAAALVATAACAGATLRRQRALAADVAALAESLRALAIRLDSAESDVAQTAVSAGVAESVLVEKGIADEEDLEEVRRRFDGEPGAAARARDGELH